MEVTLKHLTLENIHHLELRQQYLHERFTRPELYWPFLPPCQVKLLIVTDGSLDFSEADFGLSTFVRSLLDTPGRHVRYSITLAHISAVSDLQMLPGEGRIARRITAMKFDSASHFGSAMYDEVFLFGIAPSYGSRGTSADGQPYPADRLADTELRALTEFMNAGGGLFATGDHGSLGRALCHAIPRARSMRLWNSTNPPDEVSMTGARRNDTNRLGDAGSQFNDQSDDVPQTVNPRIYERQGGLFRHSYPHPLLCGPNGIIRVMPDHPHEGECIEPGVTNLNLDFNGPLGAEYPAAIDAAPRPLPEVISTSSVLAGTTSGGKDPTFAQSFGGIAAYDGHRAGVGRVATDATWHHFVNINLVGDTGVPATNPKRFGFLASTQGQAHFEEVKAYFRNLAVWLARPERISCMNTRLIWTLLWDDRVMEAVLTTSDVRLTRIDLRTIGIIGRHARDVLGRFAGRCQSVRLALDLVLREALPRLIPEIDPWIPEREGARAPFDDVGWFDGTPLLDVALGGALVALRQAYPGFDQESVQKIDGDELHKVIVNGGVESGRRAIESISRSAELAVNTLVAEKPKDTRQ